MELDRYIITEDETCINLRNQLLNRVRWIPDHKEVRLNNLFDKAR